MTRGASGAEPLSAAAGGTTTAVVITRPGGPDVLELRSRPLPMPGPGEVRVRVHAFGINRADLLQRRGRYPAPPEAPPDIPGLEFAGVVEAVGPDGGDPAPGTRVMGIAGGGCYAMHVVVPAPQLARVPDSLSWPEAAAVPEAYITAHDALARVALRPDEWLLVHAVGSGVGIAALQLAKQRGAHVIGTSRTPEKRARAVRLGLDIACDSGDADLVRLVREATGGRGADAALDLIGGPRFAQTLAALASRGRVILVGLTAGAVAEVDLGVILRQRLHIEGTVLRSRSPAEKAAAVAGFIAEALPLLASGTVRPVIDRVLPLADVAEAHRLMEANVNFGKLIVEVP